MRVLRRSVAGAILALVLGAGPAAQDAQPEPPMIVYGGDREFPPYEYVDELGRQQGFNVRLMEALAREAGMRLDVRLAPRDQRRSDFDAGRTDVTFLANTEGRADRYVLLDQTWTLSQVVIVRPGRAKQSSLNDLWGLRVAVDRGSINQELLEGLPESQRPHLTIVATRADAIRAFERGEVDGVAGNHLTILWLLGPGAEGLVEIPLVALPYQLAVLPGREAKVQPLRAALARIRASGEFDRLVEHYLTSGRPAFSLHQYLPALAAAGGVILLLFVGGAAWNRSLQRQVQVRTEAVARTERRYRDLVDNASDMIYRTDPFGRFTFVNPVAARILGYTEGDLLAMRYIDLIQPDWVPRAIAFYESAAKKRETTYFEFPVRTRDGREIWVGQHVRPITTGGRLDGFQGVARDITDRVSAQAELQAERDFVSAVLQTAPSLIMVLDAQGRIVRFNLACERLSGLSSDEALGRHVWELPFLPEPDRDEVRRNIARLVESTAPVSVDRIWLDPKGHRHWIAWTVMALRDQAGVATNLIGIGSDVTMTRELERLKSQFVSMVSHELRTPLTSIRASMQLLLASTTGPRDPEIDQLLHVALANADRLIRIVSDILDMSKIEAGELRVRPERAAPRAIIEESVRAVAGVARDAQVQVTCDVPDGLPEVVVDAGRTIQVLINLLSNAIKHAPRGSCVEVSVTREPSAIAVSVRDHGPGIPTAMLDFIFEPFTQLDTSDSRRIPGTGLGLTIARALAEKQGGTIRVESREGAGATFTVTLPIAT
jgi:PAS domain S-box-containing protein